MHRCKRCHGGGEIAIATNDGYRGLGYRLVVCPECKGRRVVKGEAEVKPARQEQAGLFGGKR